MSLSLNVPIKIKIRIEITPLRIKNSVNGQTTAPINQAIASRNHVGKALLRAINSITACSCWGCSMFELEGSDTNKVVIIPINIHKPMTM